MARIKLKLEGTTLKNPGTTKLYNFFPKKVIWEIKDENIKSFRIEGKEPGGYYPFTQPPEPNFSTELTLWVNAGETPGDWEYKIIWIHRKTNKEHTLDPKIAVKPGIGFEHLIIALLTTLTCLFGLQFFHNLKVKKHHTK